MPHLTGELRVLSDHASQHLALTLGSCSKEVDCTAKRASLLLGVLTAHHMSRRDIEASIRALHCSWRRGARPQRTIKVCAAHQQHPGEHALAHCIIRPGCHCLSHLPRMCLFSAKSCLCLHRMTTNAQALELPRHLANKSLDKHVPACCLKRCRHCSPHC